MDLVHLPRGVARASQPVPPPAPRRVACPTLPAYDAVKTACRDNHRVSWHSLLAAAQAQAASQVPPPHAGSGADDDTDELTSPYRPAATMKPGEVISERYQIEREIGRGGMGEVYLAHDFRRNLRVALKVLPSTITSDPAAAQRRFRREASAATQVIHGNVIRTYGLDQDRDRLYLTMEYFNGTTLAHMIERRGPLSVDEVRPILTQVADGLAAVHRAGIVHRDLKPENVLVNELGLVKLIDFGLAQAPFLRGVTEPSLIIGTPEYMAPEQVRGQALDARTDLYALGCLAFHLLAGVPPFEAETPLALAFRHCVDLPRPIRSLCPQVPSAMAAAIDRALSKEPAARFDSADEMKQALLGKARPRPTGDAQDATLPFRRTEPVQPLTIAG